MWLHQNLCNQSCVDWYLGYFQSSTIRYSAAMKHFMLCRYIYRINSQEWESKNKCICEFENIPKLPFMGVRLICIICEHTCFSTIPSRMCFVKFVDFFFCQLSYQERLYIIKSMVFPVVIYRCESWTIRKAECWRIDSFELWCWERLLRVPWTARRSNHLILKEINPEYSLEGLMLKFWYFGHLMQRANSLEKTLMLGKVVGRRRRGWQRMR